MMMEEIDRNATPSPRQSTSRQSFVPQQNDSSKNSAVGVAKGPEFRYLSHILWGLFPPLVILLAYGGRPTLIALCFGCIFTYIFDLLGTMEAAVLSIAVTCMGIWGTLIFASRYLLQETLSHLPILGTMTLLLIIAFFAVIASFQSLIIEFETFFTLFESIALASLPLLSSAVLTWFICVEVPAVDMSFCFVTVYFLYMMTLCIPRIQSNSVSRFAVPLNTLTTLYILPILVSVVLHISLHHSVAMSSSLRVGELFISVLYPILLTILVAEKHNNIVHFLRNEVVSADMQHGYFAIKVTVVCLLVLCMQVYSVFADMKAFSAVGEPYASMLVSALLLLVCGALLGNDDFAVAMCWTLVSLLGGVILGLELATFALAGSVAVMYRPVKDTSLRALQLLAALALVSIAAYFYAGKTLTFLLFSMTWHGSEIPVQTFVHIGVAALLLAIGIPMILPQLEKSLLALHIPSESNSESISVILRDGAIGTCVVVFTVIVSALELMLREQDWADIGAEVETVYPAYLLIATAVILTLANLHLAHIGKIRPMVCWHVVILQCCKVLHLVGYPSRSCVVLCAFLLAITRPFVAYYKDILESFSDVPVTPATRYPTIHPITTLYYLVSVAGTCIWMAGTIAPYILFSIIQREVSPFEVYASMLGIWFLFAGFIAFVFYRNQTALRSALLLLAIACMLLVSGAFEWVTLRYDASSPILLALQLHPDLNHAAVDRTVVYMFLSFGLTIAGAVNLINVRNPLLRFIFIVAVSFCASQVIHGWCFPVRVGVVLDSNAVWYLWMYSFSTAFLSVTTTMFAIMIDAPTSSLGAACLLCGVACPFLVLAIDYIFSSGLHSLQILSSTAVVNGIVAIVARLAIVSHVHSTRKRGVRRENMYFGDTVGSVASLMCFAFAVMSSGMSVACKADFVIPAASLVFLSLRSDNSKDAIDPKKLVPLLCCLWWSLSALYAILLRGGGDAIDIFASYTTQHSNHWFLYEGDVSIWSEDNIFIALMHMGLLLLSIPSILLAQMTSSKVSEDAMFVLAILSVLPVILSFVWSIRLLGVAGALFGAWSCYAVSAAQRKSDLVI